METNYTTEQLKEFSDFCARHGLRFNSMVEYQAAINQYFKE
jgi:hypothetical protein